MISKLSNSSLLSKGYYKSMLAGNSAYSQANVAISSASIHGVWTFNTSKNSNIGGYTTTDYSSTSSLDSTLKVWPSYSNSLKITQYDANYAGATLDQGSSWVINSPSTLEFWVYNKTVATYQGGRAFVWGNRSDNICTILDINNDGSMNMRTYSSFPSVAPAGSVPVNTWSWIVISRSGNELKVFVNGVQTYVGSNGDGGGYTSDGSWFTIGADYDSGYVNAPRYSSPRNFQDIAVYNAAPFHNLNNFGVPNTPITNRIV